MEQQQLPQEVMEEIVTMRRELREALATLDILVNYVQVLIEERGLQQKCRKLEEQLEEIRAGKMVDSAR